MARQEKKSYLKHPEGSIFRAGYGTIAKLPMQDKNLTIEAKAIYAYLCSYMGSGDVAFPSIKRICNDLRISKDRYYKHFNLLISQEYIRVNHLYYTKTGQWANNEYALIFDRLLPCTENKETG